MAIRLADMDRDGIDFEIAFPNGWALGAYGVPNFEFLQGAFGAYNDWAAELNKTYGKRCYIIPAVSTFEVDEAVKELQRIAKAGHIYVNIPTHPHPADHKQLYNDPRYDPIWAAISDRTPRACGFQR